MLQVGHAQQSLMELIARQAGIDPLAVDYVEAHATGTAVGDAIEGNAIARAYGSPARTTLLRLASTRSNVGHMEAASFTCSLLKILLMLQKRHFAPVSAHHKSPNPKIPWEGQRMKVQTSAEPFPQRDEPILIGINSFGFGGANGHCIVQEYKAPATWSSVPEAIHLGRKVFSVPLCAKSDEALVDRARQLAAFLQSASPEDSYTLIGNLCCRVTPHRVRTAFSAATLPELQAALEAFVAKASKNELKPEDVVRVQLKSRLSSQELIPAGVAEGSVTPPTVLFVFPGQGSQWAGCGKRLYETEPVFKRVVDTIDKTWSQCAGADTPKLSAVAFDENFGKELNECKWAQPVTFLIQAGLFEMLKAHGVHPDAVVGHSAGEAGSAYASGAYTLEEATRLVYDRARLQQLTAGCGRMLVLMMERSAVEASLTKLGFDYQGEGLEGDVVDLACFNSPNNTVVCGAPATIAKLQEALVADGLQAGKLIPGNIAFHSRHMLPIKAELYEVLGQLDGPSGALRTGPIPLLSTVTGRVLDSVDANYWWSNVRRPVNLLDTIRTVKLLLKPDVIVEISPHITLRSPIRECYEENDGTMPPYVPTLIRGVDDAAAFANALGACFKNGLLVDYRALFPRPEPMTHKLPRYPMKKERMIDDLIDNFAHLRMESFHRGPMLGADKQGPIKQYGNVFSKPHFVWMADHVVQETAIIPASGYIELLLEAFRGEPVHVVHARFIAPFTLTADPKHLHTNLEPVPHAPNRYEFTITSRPHSSLDTASTVHCVGVLEKLNLAIKGGLANALPTQVPLTFPVARPDGKGKFSECMFENAETFYAAMQARVGEAFSYGPYFRVIKRVDRDVETLNLRVEIEQEATMWKKWDLMGYLLHPTVLDGVLQIFIVYVMEAPDFSGVPQMMNDFIFVKKPTTEKLVCVYEPPAYLKGNVHQKGQLAFALGERPAGAIQIYDGVTGELVAYLGRYTSFHANAKKPDLRKSKHFLSWQPKDACNAPAAAQATIAQLKAGATPVPAATKTLIADLMSMGHPKAGTPFFVNVGEAVIGAPPSRLAMEECIGVCTDKPVQFTSISTDVEKLTALYNRYGSSHKDTHLRFVTSADVSTSTNGLLRPAMFELLVVRVGAMADGASFTDELAMHAQLVAPGGLLLLEVLGTAEAAIPAGFVPLYESAAAPPPLPAADADADATMAVPLCVKLLIAPTELVPVPAPAPGAAAAEALASHIVVDDTLGYAKAWRTTLGGEPAAHEFAQAASWTRVDYFATLRTPEDVTSVGTPDGLYDAPAALTEWCQQFVSQRSGKADVASCVFTVFTTGAVLKVTSPAQTGVWGAVRTLSLELGDACKVDFRLVDLGAISDLALVPHLAPLRERELAIRNGRLWTSRLHNLRETIPIAHLTADAPCAFRLTTDNSGAIADLQFRTLPLPELGPLDVEIAVKGAALNFRDIMVGLGRLPLLSYERSALGRTVGIECAGQVVRVGTGVKRHKVGDKVLAMQGGCIANRLRCHELAAFKMPSNVSYEQGSSLLSVYVTAYYSLIYLARMRKGQTILVHSAMGGVGQAAIALAKHTGAHVIGTAGSKSRCEKLMAMGCVAAFDSHTTSWYADVMKFTQGKGVDIVLNSLAGEHVDLCLEALAAGGWHCEIGKVDIYADRPLKMAVFRKNLAYRAIDIDRLMMDDPMLAAELTESCLELIQKGKVPCLPITCFEYSQHQAALRSMMGGLHEGKIVLTPPPADKTIEVGDTRSLYGVGKDGKPRTVLLSGCLGDFGLRLFAYVIAMGAKHILVLDRDPKRKRTVEWMRQHAYVDYLMPDSANVRIEIVRADVAVYSDVVDALGQVKALGLPPIGSVFHLAGILDDKFVSDMDRASFARVYAPKADGAWNLHRATQKLEPLDHFVMLSSTSSAFGNPGQTNYSAANSYQDGLAAMRQQAGLAGLSYCMGAVIEAGMAARNPQLLNMMKAGGMPAISSIFAIEVLDSAIRSGVHSNAVAALASDRFSADLGSSDFLRSAAQLVHNGAVFRLGGGGGLSKEALIERISSKVAALCGVAEVSPTDPLSTYGLNSISVAELGAFLKTEMAYSASAMQLMTSATCESIANGILAAQGGVDASATKGKGDEADKAKDEASAELTISRPPRVPSRFAVGLEEHFAQAAAAVAHKTRQKPLAVTISAPAAGAGASASAASPTASPLAPLAIESLGVLDGALPPKCQEALDELNGFVNSFETSGLQPVTPVQQVRRVLLTGATGFLGRHFIPYLLERKDVTIEKIYCPVRASSDEKALARVIEAMTMCGLWKDALRERLCVFAGDLHDINFGASPTLYQELSASVDGVYHFASNLKLAASFDELRKENCQALLPVMKLCLSAKMKHLWLASTLGIFPQYFCMFGNEFAERTIRANAMPELAEMKRVYPLYIGGYPWSKLLIELTAYAAAKSKGLPLAVFRLPYLYSSSKTGYTVTEDPTVRLFQATLQVRAAPGRARPFATEDAEVMCTIMANVSLNANRKHVIYHCSKRSQSMLTECSNLDMMGFHCQQVPYPVFKAQCQKLGTASPLHTFWALMDHYAPYWIEHSRCATTWPIDDSTVRDDCFPLPPKPNALSAMRATMEWILAHRETWPFDVGLMRADLSVEKLLGPSARLCETYGLDFHKVVPPYVREGLRRICAELEAPNKLEPLRFESRPAIAFNLQSRLESRVHLHALLKMHPEIVDEPLERPVFILGLNRTGTTFLHRMLEASGRFTAPTVEEQNILPAASQLSTPDQTKATERLDFFRTYLSELTDAFAGIHEMGVGLPEEDMCAHSHAFASLEYDIAFGLPEYREWLDAHLAAHGDDVYAEHRVWMQMVAWTRRRATGATVGTDARRWCFKMPWHCKSLPSLLKAYPDALLVHTHRPVMEVAGSWCSLVERQRERNVEAVERAALGEHQLQVLASMLVAGTTFRTSHPEIAPRWLDVHFKDITGHPARVAAHVITHAGMNADKATLAAVDGYVASSRKKRSEAKLHRYDMRHYQLGESAFKSKAFLEYEHDLASRKSTRGALAGTFREKLPQLVAFGLAAAAAGVAAVYSSE